MSVFVHAQGIKTVHAGGGGGSNNGKILSMQFMTLNEDSITYMQLFYRKKWYNQFPYNCGDVNIIYSMYMSHITV